MNTLFNTRFNVFNCINFDQNSDACKVTQDLVTQKNTDLALDRINQIVETSNLSVQDLEEPIHHYILASL